MALYFLKLGGSAITDKTRYATARPDVIRAAAQAIRRVRERRPNFELVLGHGSGSFGHFAAQRWGFGAALADRSSAELWRAYAETGAAAQRLNRLVTDLFLEESVPVVSLQPSASVRTRAGEVCALDTANLSTALEHNLIPLVYGDVAFDDELGMAIASTDALFAYLAPLLIPTLIIYATAVNGIFTADPLKFPDAQPIPEITPESFERIRAGVGAAHGVDVTGGMLDKLARSLALVQALPALQIVVTACDPQILEQILLNPEIRIGTRIHA
jgi:isopentenyl phosphate kinase